MQPKGYIYIKNIKWLGNPYRHTVLKCSMKLYLKVIGVVHVILAFLKVLCCSTALKTAPGTGTGSPPVAQRLLTNTWPKTRQQHKHTSKQVQLLRNSIAIHKNSKKN